MKRKSGWKPYMGGVYMLATTVLITASLWGYGEYKIQLAHAAENPTGELLSPLSSTSPTPSASASPSPSPKSTPVPSQKDAVKAYIYEIFGEELYDQAEMIFTCESGLDPSRQGDTDIMAWDAKHGEEIGDSIGICQVRTGEARPGHSYFNRAAKNGMSADEFRTKLKDYQYNIKYCKQIYDNSGWSAWQLCSERTGVK